MSPRLLPLVLATLVLAGCTGSAPGALPEGIAEDDTLTQQAVAGGAGGSGGAVANSPPAVTAFTADRTGGDNDGSLVVVFSGAAFDPNTEMQVARLRVSATGPAALGSTHEVTPAERLAGTEPAEFGPDGWKVWTAAPRDGVLQWKYRQAFPAFTPAGSYAFVANATDLPGRSGLSAPVVVTLRAFSLIEVGGAPVDLQGIPLAGQTWGGWTAEANATGVASANYLKIVNGGDASAAAVVVDFTETAFQGAEDANFSVPIDGNLEFAWFEDTTPALTAPSEGAFTFLPAGPNGATTVTFSGKGNVIYVAYRIAKLPDVLPAQAYSAAFTVTEL